MQVSYTELLLIDSPEPPSVVPSPEDSLDVELDAELVVVLLSDVVPESTLEIVLVSALEEVPEELLLFPLTVPVLDSFSRSVKE